MFIYRDQNDEDAMTSGNMNVGDNTQEDKP